MVFLWFSYGFPRGFQLPGSITIRLCPSDPRDFIRECPLKNDGRIVSWDDDIPNWMGQTCSKRATSIINMYIYIICIYIYIYIQHLLNRSDPQVLVTCRHISILWTWLPNRVLKPEAKKWNEVQWPPHYIRLNVSYLSPWKIPEKTFISTGDDMIWLLGISSISSCWWFSPSWHILVNGVGMTSHKLWKIKAMFETSNQS